MTEKLWKLMFYLRAVFLLVVASFGLLSSTTADCAELVLVNGSTNHLLAVTNLIGRCDVPASAQAVWPLDWSTQNGVFVDGVFISSWVASSGHDYRVTCSESGQSAIVDLSQFQTFWFWFGAAFAIGAGLTALGARWVTQIFRGGFNE